MTRVLVSIGSNIDREHNVRGALRQLQSIFGPLSCSRVYETEAVGFDGDNFYNLVVAFDTDEGLENVSQHLDDIEQRFGRQRQNQRFVSRTLDLDLLLYGDLIRHDDEFDLPREEITKYAFVLLPLTEVAGATLHPEQKVNFQTLWQQSKLQDQKLWPVEFDINNFMDS